MEFYKAFGVALLISSVSSQFIQYQTTSQHRAQQLQQQQLQQQQQHLQQQQLPQRHQTQPQQQQQQPQRQHNQQQPLHQQQQQQQPVLDQQSAAANALSDFSLDLLKAVSSETSGNVVISPFSVATLLSLLQQAADGTTAQQLDTALHQNAQQSRRAFKRMLANMRNRSTKSEYEVANGIFLGQDYELNPAFKTIAENDYNAQMFKTNFRQAAQTSQLINTWTAKATRDRIQNIIQSQSLYDGVEAILVNAIYFKGVWLNPFKPNRTSFAAFSLSPAQEAPVAYMHQTAEFPGGVDTDLGVKWLQMPFDGEEYSMLFLLPLEAHGLHQTLRRLTGADLVRIIRDRTTHNSVVALPKFSLQTSKSLVSPLMQLGVSHLFTTAANLPGMTTGHSHFSDALHRAEISVDEAGSRAAAATSLVVNTLSLAGYYDDFRFSADQPFAAFIVDMVNAAPIFSCIVNDPNTF